MVKFYKVEINKTEWEVPERYQMLTAVGSGAYGQVCSALDSDTGVKVAIKKIARPFQSAVHAKRTYRELRMLKHMNHENGVRGRERSVELGLDSCARHFSDVVGCWRRSVSYFRLRRSLPPPLITEIENMENSKKPFINPQAITFNQNPADSPFLFRMSADKFEVVISGVGGVFPECASFNEFHDLLFKGKSGVTVDNRRWPVGALNTPPATGKIPSYKLLDSTFFGMMPALTDVTDPLTRLSLEKTIEALVDAGVNPSELSGANTAVIVGSCISESEFIQLFSLKKLAILGANRAMQANRISFYLNLTGPSFQIDTTWVGGLQCLEQAKDLVEEGSVDGCIVCVANLTISPCVSKQMQGLGVLSQDECTRAFSSDASGYVRSEAAVAFYVQRLQDAKRSYASLVNIGVRTFGGRNGIFAQVCSPDEFQSLMEAVYERVDSNLIGYVEADGCGVKAIDSMECTVMRKLFFNKMKGRHTPLLVGSVKSNVGHTEASSSLVSVSKALVALDSGYIPANLNYREPNPNAEGLKSGELRVVTEATPLPTPLVGVTSLGLCSSFGHLVLKQHSKPKPYQYKKYEMYRDALPRLITISGRTEAGLRNKLKEIKTYPADEEFAALFHQVFKTPINQHNIRGYVLTPDICPEDETENLEQVEYYDGVRKPIWFIFSGMGSQWNEMGRDLLKFPMFRRTMDRLSAVLQPRGVDLYEVLTSDDKALFDNVLNSFVGIAACQIGLADILFALGITPDGIVGHSLGELGCAYADGCFTAEQTILAAYARGRASLETDTIHGKMAAIGKGQAEMRKLLKDKPSIEIACHNAADSCTLSGPSADIDAFVASLVAQGIFARAVNVANIAYHSRYIAPAAPKLLEYLKEVIPSPKPRSSKWVSSSILECNWDSPLAATSSPEYHTNNLLSSVYFEEASARIPQDAICIEIAPHGLLQAILKRSLADRKVTNVPLTLRGIKDGVRFLSHAFGKLYLHGLDLNLSPLYPEVHFPVSRGTKPIGHFLDWEHSHEYDLNELKVQTVLKFEREISISITDHILYSSQLVHTAHVLPSAKLLLTALESLPILHNLEPFDEPLVLQNVRFAHAVKMPTKRALKFYLMVAKGSGNFEMVLDEGQESSDVFMFGSVNFLSNVLPLSGYKFPSTLSAKAKSKDLVDTVLGDELFAHLRSFGLTQDTRCECIKQMNIYKNNLAHVVIDFLSDDWLLFLDNVIKGLIYLHVDLHYQIYLPQSIERLLIDKALLMNSIKEKNSNFVDVYYDLDTKEIQCPGLHIFGIQMKPLVDITLPNSILNVKNLSFVPYHNPTLTNSAHFATICLQLLLENIAPVEKGFKININLIEINDPNNNVSSEKPQNFIKYLKRILNLQPNIDYKVINYDGQPSDDITPEGKVRSNQQFYGMIVCEDPALTNDALNVLRENQNSYLLLTSLRHGLLNLTSNASLVSSAVIDGMKYLFVRNNEELGEGRVVFSMDVGSMERSDWRSALNMKIEEALQDNKNIYIVIESQPGCNINQFIRTVFLQDEYLFKFFQLFKFFFILDQAAPMFSITDKFYADQIALQLRINIYKDGAWGSEKFTLSDNYQVETFAYDPRHQYDQSINLKDKLTGCSGLDIKYLCISNKHLIVDEQFGEDRTCHALGPLEFAGTSKNGHKIIGIIPFHKGVERLQPDPILNWALPQDWTLEDGATVPLAYSIAYYILDPVKMHPRNLYYKYVLLSTGVNAIGLAFLNILIHRRDEHAKIFFCVKNRKHRDYIHEKYAPYVNNGFLQVFIYYGRSFEINVNFATQGEGANLIINSLSGRYLTSAMNCACRQSPRLVQLNRKDVIDQAQIGLSLFLKCTELIVFGSDDLLSLSDEIKKNVADLVDRGLKNEIVRPIPRQIVTGPHTGAEALDKLNSSIGGEHIERIVLSLERERPKSLVPVPSVNVKYTFEADKSYLIVGGKSGSWLHLAEFLLLRGARHLLVAVCHSSLSCSAVASRKLHLLLLRYPTCDIQMTGASVFDTEKDTRDRLRSSCASRELSAVFLLHMDSDLKLKNLHSVLQSEQYQYTLYISIYSNDTALCDQRKSKGLPTLCIQSEGDDRRIEKVLDILDTLLIQVHTKQSSVGTSIVLVDQVGAVQNDQDYLILQHIQAHLPESLEELEELNEQMSPVPVWQEVRSLTSRLADSKGSYPIFIVPGLRPHTKMLDKLIQRLYYPCFICKYPSHYDNLDETAKILIRELGAFNLQTFNLVAEGWGGLLALHIAKRLTQEGRYVRLTLLDAAPDTILSWVSHFSDNLELKLLSKYFPLSDKDKQELQNLSWQDKLSLVLASYPCTATSIAPSLTCLMTRLHSSFSGILNTETDKERMEHVKVLLLRPEASSESDFCCLERMCAGPISIFVGSKPDYVSFLQDPDIPVQVNENFLYDYPESETPLYFVRDTSDEYECNLFTMRVSKK